MHGLNVTCLLCLFGNWILFCYLRFDGFVKRLEFHQSVIPRSRLCCNSKKRLNSARHAGLDPASSNVILWKSAGFRVKPGMTKTLFGIVLSIVTQPRRPESSDFGMLWMPDRACPQLDWGSGMTKDETTSNDYKAWGPFLFLHLVRIWHMTSNPDTTQYAISKCGLK